MDLPPIARAGYEQHDDARTAGSVARRWWDASSAEYLTEHGEFLHGFRWCPEGLTEDEAGLLGDVSGRTVLEVGAGAAQCSAWLAARGARALATDVSLGMLTGGGQGAPVGAGSPGRSGGPLPRAVADARALPLADSSVDIAFTAFGAIPFVPDADTVHREVARVLRPGGRWVFAVVHPVRWAFPDDPSESGLTATRSYFDRRPYVERDSSGAVQYAEYHRTLGDHVADIGGAGLVLERLVEPEWPEGHDRVWGGWGPVRGARLPGTAIFVTRKAG